LKEDKIIKALFAVLILTVFTSGLRIELGFATVNFSHLVALPLFLLLILYNALNRKSFVVLYQDIPSTFIYFYFFVNVFSSILFSPDPDRSLKGCLLIFSYVLIYITTRWAMKHIVDKHEAVKKMLTFNFFSAIFGIVCMLTYLAFAVETIGISFGQLGTARIEGIGRSELPSIQSLSIEPNIFAIVTAVYLVINFCLYLFWSRSKRELLVVIILSFAVLFSYTRSVYISLLLALILVVVLSRKFTIIVRVINYSIIFFVIVGCFLFLLPKNNKVKLALNNRLTTLLEYRKGSGAARVEGLMIGVEGFRSNPVFGKGTLSANTEFYNPWRKIFQHRMGSPGWLNGVLIQALHDTGLVGVLIVLMINGSVLYYNYRTYVRLDKSSFERSIVLGFFGGNIILFIASQTSSTVWVAFPYIYWGVNLGFLAHCKTLIQHKRAFKSEVLNS
jgi:hypothetical protein